MDKGMIQIDPKLVDSLVKEHIQAAMLSVLADKKEALLSQMAHQVLNIKVNENGQIGSYERDNKYSWIEYTLNKELRDMVKECCVETIQKMKPEIEAAVRKEVARSGTVITKAIMEGFSNSLKLDWNFKVNIVER